MDFLGGLLSAGTSLMSGLFGQQNNSKNAEMAAQLASDNYQHQKEFAQTSKLWAAQDATAAEAATGINRLALLGSPTTSFSNNVGGAPSDNSMGTGIASAGQDIQRAISAYADKNDRAADLKNKLIEAQIANVNSDTVKNQAAASKLVTQAPTQPTPLYETFRDPWGKTVRLPSQKASSSLQNIASWPSNLAVGAQMLYHNLTGWGDTHGSSGTRGDVVRATLPLADQFYLPF